MGEERDDVRARLESDLKLIARNVGFRGPAQAMWQSDPLPAMAPTTGLVKPAINTAVSQLEQFLYGSFFCRPLRSADPVAVSRSEHDIDLSPSLSAANRGRDGWDPRWQVEHVSPSGQAVLRRAGRRKSAWPGEFVCRLGLGGPPRPGMPVDLLVVRESFSRQPGVYFAFGSIAFDDDETAQLLRIYWNLRPGGAALLVSEITGALDRFRVPFTFKCMARTSLLNRCDGAVLYVPQRRFPVVVALIADMYHVLAPHLGADVSPFVKPLAPGLSLAEDAADGGSFGLGRCRALAEGLWRAYANGIRGDAEVVDTVLHHLRWCGVDVTRPYLNPGSVDRYDVPEDLRSAFDRTAR